MIDLLRCLFGYWPRRHSACPVVSRVLLADMGERGIYSITRRLPSGSTVTTTENLAKE